MFLAGLLQIQSKLNKNFIYKKGPLTAGFFCFKVLPEYSSQLLRYERRPSGSDYPPKFN